MLGSIDGTITTFAIVAGVAGANLNAGIALVLGLANVLADGFSMAVSNYLGTKSEREQVEQARRDDHLVGHREHVIGIDGDGAPEGQSLAIVPGHDGGT